MYLFQSDDMSSYKNKYFTLMSAMKQLQNTFLRAQQNAERNVKGTSIELVALGTLFVFTTYVKPLFSFSSLKVMSQIAHWLSTCY